MSEEPAAAAHLSAEALFRAHVRFVAGFVARLGVSQEAVDDVVQEVFLAAHRRGGYVQGAARPTTWLAEIALRVVSTHKRTKRRKDIVVDEGALETAVSPRPSAEDIIERKDALSRVEKALESLELRRRAVFILFEIEGESCDTIAAGLGVPVGTVYSRLHAARKEFEQAYERLSREPRRPIKQGAEAESGRTLAKQGLL